jgi:hypothetical protein
MPWVEFEPTVPASERAKTVHALDRSATVTGNAVYSVEEIPVPNSRTSHRDKLITSCMEEVALPNLRIVCTVGGGSRKKIQVNIAMCS